MPKSLAYGLPLDSLDVVLVHDNRGAQGILRSMISSMRIGRLRVYEHAEKALNDMLIDPPSALIAEWDMKPMSGYRLTRLIRNRTMEPLSFVPILAVTPMPTLSLVDRAFSVGVTNIIVMPVSPVVLRRRIELLAHDDREFVLQGDNYVIDGIEEVLEERVRRTNIADMLKRQKAMQEALARRAQTAQDLVDRIVNGEVDLDDLEGTSPPPPVPAKTPRKPRSTWSGWTVR
ncbi:two-component system chemotaxis response regulator CheY [Tepidamorphus gemmatus]|uniref:Two-component system chemotaxis response regulator CheY n=1 Tax=Tepidamorphus gemmatus TaxID=747076 RepID=A0A4R3MCR0_9HYPH|nr:response regulator [Tepidamorphus gemmatus]TCT11331.1 two-component system chemotaxis response regulator CheY [Tepidamorphus gemmatus]